MIQLSPISQAQNPLNAFINPQQSTSTDQAVATTKAADQVSISAAAKALAGSEVSETRSTEVNESSSSQQLEGEASSSKSLNITA